ncbi:MAG: hypothetical protein FWF43_08660, partial [Propionibacteriaceae bacterium]|nr:hypothetical protein [Propionibacteriaceae bacterium]
GTYTIVHGMAEFVTSLVLFSMLAQGVIGGTHIVVYSVIAFGMPIVLAVLASQGSFARLAEGRVGLGGLVLLAIGVLFPHVSMVVPGVGWGSVLLLGLGSAMFHICAGTATLKLPRRGMAVGVFESSGAIGLALGTLLGSGVWKLASTTVWAGLLAAVVVLGGLAVLMWGTVTGRRNEVIPARLGIGSTLTDAMPECPQPSRPSWTIANGRGLAPALVLVGLAVMSLIRSTTGFAAPQPWKDSTAIVVWAAIAVMCGRAIGGVIADRWGAFAPALAGFVGAAVFMGLWPGQTWAGLAGVFCLALPMAPVILGLVASTRRPGLSFGMAQLFQVPAALMVGLVYSQWIVLVVLLLCAVLVFSIKPLDEKTDHSLL